ncbi:hypothetical protein ACQPXM_25580 [Kribbella sp. CA-253562]|uniref:hypothetical protein n=1 Tax=Kribbella sp. CA-253562 TaxID=3239942 RepID=UPI003D8E9F27
MTIRTAEEFIGLRFSGDPREYRRAATESADVSVWMDIIRDYPEARVWVAHNKTVPMEVLAILAHDTNDEVRFAVAMKRRLSSELLDLLARDSKDSVRFQVAKHRNTSASTLLALTDDPWQAVAELAAERLQAEHSPD